MHIKTYRARTMQEALNLVRSDLGPDAAVLHTREVSRNGLFRWWSRGTHIEVTASDSVNVPSRLPTRAREQQAEAAPPAAVSPSQPAAAPAHLDQDYRAQFRTQIKRISHDAESMVERLSMPPGRSQHPDLPDSLFRLYADMIEADVSEEYARDLVEQVRHGLTPEELLDAAAARARLLEIVEGHIREHGPIRVTRGRQRIVALVGPTGVGKTTTIAKLAANFRLREKMRVGLITVDTYRIAAVEQLRTYAEIIDLPMEVVSTPREMRAAVARMHDLDLVLMDTAGRSPRDEIRIQELRSILGEAGADEVHLVLSSVASANHLVTTVDKFAEAGTTALLLTKLDESAGLGALCSVLSRTRLPISYLTDGQNVPDDITTADCRRLAARMLGMREGERRQRT